MFLILLVIQFEDQRQIAHNVLWAQKTVQSDHMPEPQTNGGWKEANQCFLDVCNGK